MLEVAALLMVGTAILAAVAPGRAVGVAILVSCTSSLPWQAGGPNLALPLWCTSGLTVGLWVWSRRGGAREVAPMPPALDSAWVALMTFVLTAVGLGWARQLPDLSRPVWNDVAGAARSLGGFNPAGLAHHMGSGINWILLPLAFPLLVRLLCVREIRRQIGRAAVLGAGLMVLAPAFQYIAGAPLSPRADHRISDYPSGAIVGFSQDPHGHAALLLVVGCVLCGFAVARAGGGRRWLALALAPAGVAAFAEVIYTHSMGGVLAALCAIAVLGTIAWRAAAGHGVRVVGAITALGTVTALLGLVLLSVDVMPGRGFAYELLNTKLGNVRTWRFLDPGSPPQELLRARWTLAEKGAYLTTTYPVWGVGSGSFAVTDAPEELEAKILPALRRENSHSTYVQIASELGVGAAASWVLLLGLTLVRGIRGCRRDLCPNSALLAGPLAAVVGLSVIGLGSHPVLLPELHFIYWLVLAASVALSQPEGSEPCRPAVPLASGRSLNPVT